jgi:acyl-CoA thioesterase-1
VAKRHKAALVPFLLEGMAEDLGQFQPDRIHPNEAAQPILLDNVWKKLKPLLK